MAQVLEVVNQPILEAPLGDQLLFNAHLRQEIRGELAGFVVRQAGVRDTGGQVDNCATIERVRSWVAADIELSSEMKVFVFPDSHGDKGLHLDKNEASPSRTQLNFYVVSQGSIGVCLVPLRPARTRSVLAGHPLQVEPKHAWAFEQGQVDGKLFSRQCFTAVLEAADVLVFADALSPHRFRTIESPRRCYANVLCAALLA